MIEKDIQELLFSLRDEKYREFNAKLIPTVPINRMIGVKTPELRKIADKIMKTDNEEAFLSNFLIPTTKKTISTLLSSEKQRLLLYVSIV